MTTKRWLGVLGFTIFGILLFASWLLPGQAGFWYELDKSVFFFFNHLIGQSQALLYVVAFTNLRPFDAVAFLFMLGIFYHYYRLQDAKGAALDALHRPDHARDGRDRQAVRHDARL